MFVNHVYRVVKTESNSHIYAYIFLLYTMYLIKNNCSNLPLQLSMVGRDCLIFSHMGT